MPNVYIEARSKGRQEGSPIDDYVVEDHANHVLAAFKTQHEAIAWAKNQGHAPLIARVRHLNDKREARPLARAISFGGSRALVSSRESILMAAPALVPPTLLRVIVTSCPYENKVSNKRFRASFPALLALAIVEKRTGDFLIGPLLPAL